jgi:hypothetical protein
VTSKLALCIKYDIANAAEVVYPSSQYNRVGPLLTFLSISSFIRSKSTITWIYLLNGSCKKLYLLYYLLKLGIGFFKLGFASSSCTPPFRS